MGNIKHTLHQVEKKKKAFKNRGKTIVYLSKGAEKLEFPAVL